MGKQDKYAPRIRYHYETLPEARLHPAHGVWGGINGQGELEICFYNESERLPPYIEQSIEPDGTLGPEMYLDQDGVRHIQRTIHSKIVMNYQSAVALRDWLQDRVAEMEADGAGLIDFNPGIEQ